MNPLDKHRFQPSSVHRNICARRECGWEPGDSVHTIPSKESIADLGRRIRAAQKTANAVERHLGNKELAHRISDAAWDLEVLRDRLTTIRGNWANSE